jgi:diguanylate cyclase (GGDEF)-like protein
MGSTYVTHSPPIPVAEDGLDGDEVPPAIARRLARALDRTPAAVAVLLDADLTIRWLSRSATWVTGSDPGARRGNSSLERVHPDDVDRLLHGIAVLRAASPPGGEGVPVVTPLRYRFRRWDTGEWALMEAHVHNLLHDPAVNGMLVISRAVDGHLDGVGHVIDLLTADAPLPTILAACAAPVPSAVGSAAVVGVVGRRPVVGAPAGTPAERFVADDRWWRPPLRDGVARVADGFADFPDDVAAPARDQGFLTAWSVPLFEETSRDVVGCLVTWVRIPVGYSALGDDALRQAQRLATLVIGDQRRQHALRRAAHTDPLTGVGNRTALRRRLDAITGSVTVIMIDLDHFKPVNDTYGHAAGDAVLEIVATRIVAAVRHGDLVVRLGGDEFAVVLLDGAPGGGATSARRIQQSLERPIKLPDGRTVTVGASVGLATHAPDEVVSRADAALYQAKRARGRLRPRG